MNFFSCSEENTEHPKWAPPLIERLSSPNWASLWSYVVEFISLAKLKFFTHRLILIDIFFLTENKYCYDLEVEEGRKVARVSDDGGCWVVIMDSSAKPSLHAHCGTLESRGRSPEEVMEAGRRLSGPRSACPAPLHRSRAVFVLSASLQCCLVAFRSSSIVQGYERTKNGLPLGVQLVQLYSLSLFIHFCLKLFF